MEGIINKNTSAKLSDRYPILKIWPYFVFFALIVAHLLILSFNKSFFGIITPIVSKLFQIIGTILVIIVLNENSKTLDSENLFTQFLNFLFSLGLFHKTTYFGANLKVYPIRMRVNPTIIHNPKTVIEKLDSLQSQINEISNQIDAIRDSYKNEINEAKNEFSKELSIISQKVNGAFLGSIKYEFLGCLFIIYGVACS